MHEICIHSEPMVIQCTNLSYVSHGWQQPQHLMKRANELHSMLMNVSLVHVHRNDEMTIANSTIKLMFDPLVTPLRDLQSGSRFCKFHYQVDVHRPKGPMSPGSCAPSSPVLQVPLFPGSSRSYRLAPRFVSSTRHTRDSHKDL